MKSKRIVSLLCALLVILCTTSAFAQEPAIEETEKMDNVTVKARLTDEETGKQIEIQGEAIGDPIKVSPKTRSNSNVEQYQQSFSIMIPKYDSLGEIDTSNTDAHRTDNHASTGADFVVTWSRQSFQLGARGGTARKLDRLSCTYHVQEPGTWFTEARLGYEAKGYIMSPNFIPVDEKEDQLCVNAARDYSGVFVPSKEIWVTYGSEPDILRGTLYGVLFNGTRQQGWRCDITVDVG